VGQRRNPARLVVALSVAAVLAVFLVYVSFAGGGTPLVQPSELDEHEGNVQLGGVIVGPVEGNAREDGLRFEVRDVKGSETVPVVYKGSVPDQFKVGREVMVEGELRSGAFVADRMITKCPSKYSPSRES
jgi:cytochrome c-type biogenesis protein CcmE